MNSALLAQGQQELVFQGDGSDEYRVLARNWPQIVETELEDGNYHFARKHDELHERQTGAYGFDYGYSVPLDSLHIRDVFPISTTTGTRRPIDWLQDGENVYCNEAGGVVVEYTTTTVTDLFSSNFRTGVQKKLEAVILRSLKEEYAAADRSDQAAEMYFQRARTSSSKARTSKPMYRDPGRLTSARRGRG